MIQSKFWQAFFALAPFIGLFLIIGGYVVFVISVLGNLEELEHSMYPPMTFFGGLGFLLFMVLLIVLVSIGSLIFYIVHAVQNPNLQHNNLLLVWILLFIFASGIGQLIYWIVEILAKNKQVTSQ